MHNSFRAGFEKTSSMVLGHAIEGGLSHGILGGALGAAGGALADQEDRGRGALAGAVGGGILGLGAGTIGQGLTAQRAEDIVENMFSRRRYRRANVPSLSESFSEVTSPQRQAAALTVFGSPAAGAFVSGRNARREAHKKTAAAYHGGTIGLLGGAALGAGLGALTDKEHRGRNALIGGALGGALGSYGGDAIDTANYLEDFSKAYKPVTHINHFENELTNLNNEFRRSFKPTDSPEMEELKRSLKEVSANQDKAREALKNLQKNRQRTGVGYM